MYFLDLFSGAGGLTEGFIRQGFKPIAHIEMDKNASLTLETRNFFHILNENNSDDYYAYIHDEISRNQLIEDNNDLLKSSHVINKEIDKNSEKSLIKKIKNLMKSNDITKIDGIIGGPPCQAYSCAGRGRSYEKMKNDPRNYLYRHYLNFLKEFKPDFFVFENVPGMLSAKTHFDIFPNFKSQIHKLHYNIFHEILVAKDFNVLQNRRRLIVIGSKNNINTFNFNKCEKSSFKINDILVDLPKLQAGEGTDSAKNYIKKSSKYLKEYNIRTKKDKVIQHSARNHNNRDREIYRLAINDWNKNKSRLKYDELPVDLKTHKNQKSFIDRFKVVAGDLPYSHTIMAHLSKDGHYFIHPDIQQARSITVREAARIQSFPDNYKFEGPRTSQFKQVGNAVPPLMAEEIANKIKKVFS